MSKSLKMKNSRELEAPTSSISTKRFKSDANIKDEDDEDATSDIFSISGDNALLEITDPRSSPTPSGSRGRSRQKSASSTARSRDSSLSRPRKEDAETMRTPTKKGLVLKSRLRKNAEQAGDGELVS